MLLRGTTLTCMLETQALQRRCVLQQCGEVGVLASFGVQHKAGVAGQVQPLQLRPPARQQHLGPQGLQESIWDRQADRQADRQGASCGA